tara:strand:+ start:316 stop:582 length:267 start_codon:yes stop_codon:yes gene_type:complete
LANKADVYIKYSVLVEYRNVDLDDYDMPDLPDPKITNELIQSARVDFESLELGHDSVKILEVEPEEEDIYHIEKPDDRPTEMPEGGAY